MANNLLKECTLCEPCSYLQDHTQTIHYKIIQDCTKEQCEALIMRGWRRFGHMYFRPICSECRACESLKINALDYEFSKSERRILRKNSTLKTIIRHPTMSQEHIDLFYRYHQHKHITRNWDAPKEDPRNYYSSFVNGHGDFGFEILYFDDERLIAVDLVDILNEGISSLYCYYDPDYSQHSLGKYTLLAQIQLAKHLGLSWIYLGYFVEGCQSLSYKSEYTPSKILVGRPEETMNFEWKNFR